MSHVKITGCETAILNDGGELHVEHLEADAPVIFQNGATGSVVDSELTGKQGVVSRNSEVTRLRNKHRPTANDK